MKNQTRWRHGGLILLLGAVSVALWLALVGGPAHIGVGRIRPFHLLLLAAITSACILLRFVRWQYLLRRMDVRVPTRRSLSIYLASLLGIATPGYVGEISRAVLVRRETGGRLGSPLLAVVLERLLDLLAVGLIGLVTSGGGLSFALALGAVLGALLLGRVALALAQRYGSAAALQSVMQWRVLGLATLLTLISWTAAASAISLAAATIGAQLGMLDSMRVFATATLAGGLSLIPAGIAVTGSLTILQLQALGFALHDAVLTASMFRLGTVAVTLGVACAFGIREWLLLRRRQPAAQKHFDTIAEEYLDQFSPHIWNLLLARRLDLIMQHLPAPGSGAIGIDLGCGLGHQCESLNNRGYQVIGLDAAHGLLRFARGRGTDVVNGSATTLPFADASVDFVYTIGVLHHLPSREDQRVACREVARVLKPGGVFIVHESNTRNPLFRFYMGYVFPVLKSIDEGTELWLAPDYWRSNNALDVVAIRHFTFLPDFVPHKLLNMFMRVERWLERGPLRSYSVHYMSVMRKPEALPADRTATNEHVLQSA